jgi:hypothetical protein
LKPTDAAAVPSGFYAALVEALVVTPEPGTALEIHRQAVATSAIFAAEQIASLTPELRWPLLLGLFGFRSAVRLQHLRSFTRLPLETRRRILGAWAFGPVPLTRQLFRPIRTTALIAYYEAVSSAEER